jgi:hypothetical protein
MGLACHRGSRDHRWRGPGQCRRHFGHVPAGWLSLGRRVSSLPEIRQADRKSPGRRDSRRRRSGTAAGASRGADVSIEADEDELVLRNTPRAEASQSTGCVGSRNSPQPRPVQCALPRASSIRCAWCLRASPCVAERSTVGGFGGTSAALLGIRHPECDRGAPQHGQRNRISASLQTWLTANIQKLDERVNPPPRMPARHDRRPGRHPPAHPRRPAAIQRLCRARAADRAR